AGGVEVLLRTDELPRSALTWVGSTEAELAAAAGPAAGLGRWLDDDHAIGAARLRRCGAAPARSARRRAAGCGSSSASAGAPTPLVLGSHAAATSHGAAAQGQAAAHQHQRAKESAAPRVLVHAASAIDRWRSPGSMTSTTARWCARSSTEGLK